MLKLSRLPDRTPVKLTIWISPDLQRSLNSYADLYHESYGTKEAAVDLVPGILATFLAEDRHFGKWCRDRDAVTKPGGGQ